jgi:hypothetical protein
VADWFPKSIDEVSTDWLSGVFDAEVRGFEKTFLPGGVLGDAYKLKLEYEGDSKGAPPSVVIKHPTEIEDRREMAISNKAYVKELRFFETATAGLPISVPKVYAPADDSSPEAANFLILMEDLTTHSTVFDQLNDPPDVAFAAKFCQDIAELHGHFWESERLTESWIGRPDDTSSAWNLFVAKPRNTSTTFVVSG